VTGSGRTPARLDALTELRLGEAQPFAVEFLHGVEQGSAGCSHGIEPVRAPAYKLVVGAACGRGR
jgi:hypothetical protein